LLPHDVELAGLGLDDLLGRRDPPAQRCLIDRRDDDIGGQRQIGRSQVEPLI
jgi:hypothetical protein